MTWVKLDDRIFDNPKIAALSDRAKVAYIEGLTYCARELTDGFIPTHKAKGIAGKASALKELTPHLWETATAGYQVHDYTKFQPKREQVMEEKARLSQIRSQAGSKGASKRWQNSWQNDGKTDGPVTPIPEGDFNNPLPIPDPETPYHNPVPLPRRAVVVGFEKAFGRLLSPTELELVKALEEEHPSERIEFALREAAALNKRSVRYVQRTCERIANDDSTEPSSGIPNARQNPNGLANGVPGLDGRSAAIARLGRKG